MINQEVESKLLNNKFACNVNDDEITYFGKYPKVYSCADHPKKPTKRLMRFVRSLGYKCYIIQRENFFWNKTFYHLKFY